MSVRDSCPVPPISDCFQNVQYLYSTLQFPLIFWSFCQSSHPLFLSSNRSAFPMGEASRNSNFNLAPACRCPNSFSLFQHVFLPCPYLFVGWRALFSKASGMRSLPPAPFSRISSFVFETYLRFYSHSFLNRHAPPHLFRVFKTLRSFSPQPF